MSGATIARGPAASGVAARTSDAGGRRSAAATGAARTTRSASATDGRTGKAVAAATSIAAVIVLIELWVIAWIRAKYMDTPFLQAAFQVVLGGVLVFLAGILIGSA